MTVFERQQETFIHPPHLEHKAIKPFLRRVTPLKRPRLPQQKPIDRPRYQTNTNTISCAPIGLSNPLMHTSTRVLEIPEPDLELLICTN